MSENKLKTWFLKTLYRLFHNKKFHHNKNIWYLFNVSRNHDNEIVKVTYKNEELKINTSPISSKKHKSLIIVATGPSVNEVPKHFFDQEQYDFLGVNGAIALSEIKFKFYCIIDQSFVSKRVDLVRQIVSNDEITLFCNYLSLHEILKRIDLSEINCSFKILDLVKDGIGYLFLDEKKIVNESHTSDNYHWLNGYGFSSDMNKLVFDYGTVAYPALQVGYSMGYKQLYFVGLDMNNFDKPRFYENRSNMLPTSLSHHFIIIQNAFNSASRFLTEKGVTVINLSPNSAITSFQKENINALMKNKNIKNSNE
ncbi:MULTISPECIES: lipopolysaccharide core biosynthesis protein RfaZ [Providencia]|uniref:Lipopolysaccharide core biosynthesis protein RfaZ n=4 Tax=Providencia TaxID=586 RepID=A0ABT9AW27_9GAMM|nr:MULTISPECIES: lipopolysaccharide core biosynthesis protein RfaZ [Providencia]ELR5138177.1 lipopolysaccharide core biosynthesis protein RfaZ [Providencia rettgeri]ELR5169005.1 lipopolysaccharide core biosynthesis protein RfaZ [Providencia rettgeri]MBQ0267208.1 lipopolysaccharide core biosynthesis protein RfaZ [Providencia huaxiensis]MDO7829539.1 lipopolysaccharide core biosynthesis protein RfaZ [Providencia sp. CRE-138-0026]MDO7858841.1 lipopolysaccharide core biosynthesis protein RfaZ [Prov